MKTKRIVLSLVAILAVLGIAARIWYVNATSEKLVCETYEMGETVPFGDNYYVFSDYYAKGYDVTVHSATVQTLRDYMESNGLGDRYESYLAGKDDDYADRYIYDVDLTIGNRKTEEEEKELEDSGFTDSINMMEFDLSTSDGSYQVEWDLLCMLYPKLNTGSFGFRIMPGTEFRMHIPYVVLNVDFFYPSIEEVKQKPTYLLLSMYPVKKMIRVIPS